jgi:hypothetical protein
MHGASPCGISIALLVLGATGTLACQAPIGMYGHRPAEL